MDITILQNIQIKDNVATRVETIDNQAYTVYPVVMMKEGVHNDVLYTLEELSKFPDSWNGIPVPIQHPKVDGNYVSANNPQIYTDHVIGKIFNTHVDGDALKAEVWLNNDKLNNMAPDVRDFLQADGQMDVSTGLFSDDIFQQGDWNGEPYEAIATNIRPDHLAILPGVTGACSWADGCGIRANNTIRKDQVEGGTKKVQGNEESDKTDTDFVKEDKNTYFTPADTSEITVNAKDYTEVVELLHDAVSAMDVDNQRWYYLSRAYDTYAIYRVNYNGSNQPSVYMKQDYSIVDGKVVWTSEAVEVVKQVMFEQKTVKTNEEKTEIKMKENEEMAIKTMKECCPAKVDELIKNNSNFTEDDKETLLAMSEDAFALVINTAKPIEKVEPKEDPKPEPVVNDDKKEREIKLEDLPKALQESVKFGQKVMQEKRTELITNIKANESNQFTDDELNTFDMDMLEKLAGSIPKAKANASDYSLNNPGGFVVNDNNAAPEPLPNPSNNWEKE